MADVYHMSSTDKIGEAMERSLPLLPAEARATVQAMLNPATLAIIAGTLVVWAGSHFVGIGEIVDLVLLATGVIFLGLAVFSGAAELYYFATTAIEARTDRGLDRAAKHFAGAVNTLGISVISALLLRSSARAVVSRGRPQFRRLPNIGRPPPPGIQPTITRPFALPNGALGATDVWGNITVVRNQSLVGQRLTLYHEWMHSVLSPRFWLFRRFRAQISFSAYERSALLRYLEEALAESYAQLRVHGFKNLVVGIRFPLEGGYVTLSQIASEGIAIGNIVVGSSRFYVYISTTECRSDSGSDHRE